MERIKHNAEQEYLDTLKNSGLLKEVGQEKREDAAKELDFQIRTYSKDEIIFFEGEPVDEIAVLHSGTVRGEKFHMEGNVDLMYIYRKGETFGAEAAVSRLKSSPLTYAANQETSVILIPFHTICQSAYADPVTRALLQILADDNIKKLYKIEVLSKRGLRDRIMTYLRIISQKAGSKIFSIHMDRMQFAQYLCVNRSALSYELNQMKRDGLIRFQKDRFEILEKNDQNVGMTTNK